MGTEVYITKIENNLLSWQYDKLLRLVAPEKRERILRFHHYADAQRTLLGDILVRRLAQLRLGLPNNEINFITNEFEKPFLERHPEFCFNVSHSGRYVACALDDCPVGIDIEEIKPVDLRVAKRFFTSDELAYVTAQAPEHQAEAFFSIWTKKESFVKRDGKGLSIPTQSFSVCKQTESGLYYHQVYAASDAIASVCTEKPEPPSLTLLDTRELAAYDG